MARDGGVSVVAFTIGKVMGSGKDDDSSRLLIVDRSETVTT